MLGQRVRHPYSLQTCSVPEKPLSLLAPKWWAVCAAHGLHQGVAGKHPAVRLWGAQVYNIHGDERGGPEAAHLLRMPQGALLRAALSESGVGRTPSSLQAAAGGPGLSAPLECCLLWAWHG